MRIVQFQQGSVAIETFDKLAQPRPFDGIEIARHGPGHRLRADIEQPETGLPAGKLMRQIRHALRLAVRLQAAAFQQTVAGRHRLTAFRHPDAGNGKAFDLKRLNITRNPGCVRLAINAASPSRKR